MPTKIKSPCIKVCKIENNTCIGCGRTLYEIQHWMKYSDNERDQIIKRVSEK